MLTFRRISHEKQRLSLSCFLLVTFYVQTILGDSSEVNTFYYDPEPICDRLDIPGYPNYYMEMIDFHWQTLACPNGAVYESLLCGCIYVQTVPPPTVLTKPPTTTTVTTTTTTPAPTTTRKKVVTTTQIPWKPPIRRQHAVLSLKAAKKQCSGCKFEGGVGYKTHDKDCNMYIMCSPGVQHGDFRADVRSCGIGEYWDQEWLTCRSSKDVICETDVCKGRSNLLTYSHTGDCRAYWKCENGVSVGHCCPKGEGYSEGVGCVRSSSCNSLCGEEFSTGSKDCDKTPFPGNPKKFRQTVPGHGKVEMNCAAGTIFEQSSCSCQTDASRKPRRKECQRDLDLSFTNRVVDTSSKHVHIREVNLTFMDRAACFNGSSAIVVPRFANSEIGQTIEIRLRFKFVRSVGSSLQAVLFNGDCGMKSSIVIAASRHKVEFKLTNKNNITKTVDVHIPIKTNQWISGKYTLHKNKMTMMVEGRTESTMFFGSVARSRCGLKLGWGKDYESFVGCINQMTLSFCPENKT